MALAVLVALLFSKQLYVSSLSSYYIFYLIDKFGVSTQAAQLYLFIFLAANAVGAFFGGPLGDRFGRKYVIWFSILGALPFTLALPYAGLIMDASGNLFGTTSQGGANNQGTVFEIPAAVPEPSTWVMSVASIATVVALAWRTRGSRGARA